MNELITNKRAISIIEIVAEDDDLLEIGRKAIEDVLVDFRDGRISQLRNNGLVIKEYDGRPSDVIRIGPEDALQIGLKAIAKHLKEEEKAASLIW